MTAKTIFKSVFPKSFYNFCRKVLVRILSAFIKTDYKMILFISYDGKKYDDSPRVIYEKILGDERFFKEYKFIWGFINPRQFEIAGSANTLKIKTGTLKYYYYALKAKCCITNANNGIWDYKKKTSFCFNTWHGAPIKKIGAEPENKEYAQQIIAPDILCAQGEYDADILSRIFGIDRAKILISGLPRNDALANCNDNCNKNIRLNILNKLSLPKDKKIILYCPTFRDYDMQDNNGGYSICPPVNFKEWKNKIGKDYIILFRAHYYIMKILNIEFNDFIYDFSDYGSLNDLMIISDLLISDYSSIYFDYSVMGKPMLCFAYDYGKYMQNRGLYIDIKKELPCEIACKENALLSQILNLDYEKMSHAAVKFREKYVGEFGNAANICVDKIWESIRYEGKSS